MNLSLEADYNYHSRGQRPLKGTQSFKLHLLPMRRHGLSFQHMLCGGHIETIFFFPLTLLGRTFRHRAPLLLHTSALLSRVAASSYVTTTMVRIRNLPSIWSIVSYNLYKGLSHCPIALVTDPPFQILVLCQASPPPLQDVVLSYISH